MWRWGVYEQRSMAKLVKGWPRGGTEDAGGSHREPDKDAFYKGASST